MAASYPGATAVFPARSDGQTIFSQHINALQDEIVAIESTLTATASGGVPSPLVVSGVRSSVVLDWPAAGVLKSRFFAGASGPAAVLACNLNFDNGTAWLLDDVTQPGALVQVTPAGVLNFFTAPLGAGARALVLPFHTDITGVYERQRAAAMGDWTTIAFNAANFTCAPGMTWTVVAGGQNTYQYAMVGKSVVLAFDITGTIGGTPAAYVNVALPFAASKGFIQPVWAQNGIGVGTLSGSLINVYRDPGLGVVYTAGAMRVAGVITFPV